LVLVQLLQTLHKFVKGISYNVGAVAKLALSLDALLNSRLRYTALDTHSVSLRPKQGELRNHSHQISN
jgi:hypothetical protein